MTKKISILIMFILLFFVCSCNNDTNKETYIINFIVNNEIYSSISIEEGTYLEYSDVSVPEEEGYIFRGWSSGDTILSLYNSVNVVSDMEFEASFVSDSIDPYENMDEDEFYDTYITATCYLDSYYRSLHGLMSGYLDVPDQEPYTSSYQLTENGLYLRNTDTFYVSDGLGWQIRDVYGNLITTIYEGGAYITLDEVAAYLYAFGDVPANYVVNKTTIPTMSIWGEYLRLNHTSFSGDVDKYPYEPVLPNIRGAGGVLYYYEIDFGTTGTDCDSTYQVKIYNDGKTITRGAARLVYTRYDADGEEIDDPNERYVFYTYNHYNDFQEYLNYYGGWGEIFGNITGGGTLSSKTDYNPTDYVETINVSFSETRTDYNVVRVLYKKEEFIYV